MSDLRKAALEALEALEALQGGCTDHDDGTVEAITVWCPEVIDDLRAALAQPDQPAADGPELPVPIGTRNWGTPTQASLYNGDQMIAFRAEGVAQERERCAKVCDDLAANDKLSNYYAVAARAIRKG